jgi:hypothetical protein
MLNDQLDIVRSNFKMNCAGILDSLKNENSRLQELLNPRNDFEIVKRARKDTTWAKAFNNIRQHASSLHTALKNGWNCSCEGFHPGYLRLQEHATEGMPPQFDMKFVVAPEDRIKVTCEVVISIKENEPTENLSPAGSSASQANLCGAFANHFVQLNDRPHNVLAPNMYMHQSSPLSDGYVAKVSFRPSKVFKDGSNLLSKTSEVECARDDGKSRYIISYRWLVRSLFCNSELTKDTGIGSSWVQKNLKGPFIPTESQSYHRVLQPSPPLFLR